MVSNIDFSVSNLLHDMHGINIRPGKKGKCPTCRKNTFSIKKDDSMGTCFHPGCNWKIISPRASNSKYGSISLVLEQIHNDFHRNLLSMENSKKPNAYEYLFNQRLIHPQVIEDSMLGAVPANYDIGEKFEQIIKKAEEDIESAKESRKKQRGRPKKSIGLTPEEQLEGLKEVRHKLEKCVKGSPGWICFFYTDDYHRIVAIRFRKPSSKQILFFKPFENVAGLFGHGLSTLNQSNNFNELNDILVVTEGEFNQLQLQSLILRYGEVASKKTGYLFACAVGGVDNTDYDMIMKISHTPLICYDNDDNGAGFALVDRALQKMSVKAFTTPQINSDLDSYIRSFGENYIEGWEEITRLVSKSELYPRDYDGVKEEVYRTRQLQFPGGKLKAFEVNSDVAELIINDLNERGAFYYNDFNAYFFDAESRQLMPIDGRAKEFNLLMSSYGLNSSESIFRYLLEAIRQAAFRYGSQAEVYKLRHYDAETFTLYLFNQRDKVYRISPDSIDVVDNGTDGVLFISDPNSEPFELVEVDESLEVDESFTLLDKMIVSKINFSREFLSPSESRLIITLWLYSLFFESIQPTRPILAMIGPKGSGKSITLRMIGMLLYGKQFNVTGLTRDVRDFDTLVTQKDFIVVDNAEDQPEWFNDRLAILATGGSLRRRQLFTDSKLLEQPVRSFVAVTSRKPHFTRDDVSDRLIILKVDRLKKFQAEKELLSDVLKNRNLVMSEIVKQLQEIVIALQEEKDTEEIFDFRIADFASFVLKIARAVGIENVVERILTKLMREQSVFTLESDPIFDLLWAWANKNSDREVTAAELCNELSELAVKLGVNFAYRGQTRSFAQKIAHMRSDLEEFFDISSRTVGGRKRLYKFKPKTNISTS